MKESSTYYIDLITKYLSGEATSDEMEEIAAWIKLDSENREEFIRLSRLNVELRGFQIDRILKTDEEWATLQKRFPRKRYLWIYRAAAILLIFLVPAIAYYYFSATAEMVNITAANQIREIILMDGSRITLNQGATLEYPEKFPGSLREVRLSGEAWFEVAHNPRKPFIVNAGNIKVEVLGTSFSVNENAGSGKKEVFLEKGKVRLGFNDMAGNTEILTPGEVANISASNHNIHKSINSDPNIAAWKTRHLVFNNTPFIQALNTISEVYNVEFKILEKSPGEKNITVTFDHQSLESVIHVLEATLDLQIRNNNGTWEVRSH